MNQLVVAPNWLGDGIMAFPAVRGLRAQDPEGRLTVVGKPHVLDLWSLCSAVDEQLVFEPGPGGPFRTASRLRPQAFDRVFVLPRSFRSALAPWVARVPERVGRPSCGRNWMLTRVMAPSGDLATAHQSREYAQLCGVPIGEAACLDLEAATVDACRSLLPADAGVWLGLVPGASRGPAKRWPAESFSAVGRRAAEAGARVAVFGSPGERELCAAVAAGVGPAAVDFSGRTTLIDLAACLHLCGAVVANDSGGMHLAAAAGTRVVAIFGRTDPCKTGPLGEGHAILQESETRGREIAREDGAAVASLARITPEQAWDALAPMLAI